MRILISGLLVLLVVAGWCSVAEAHGVAERDARLLESIDGVAVGPLLYLGAKHMVTGYDHLLFLAGVVFYLHRLRHIVLYVSLFTVGHSVTLLAGAMGGIRIDPFLIDALIGLSVVYKAFENMGGFVRLLGWQPDSRAAVFGFGLCHGLGLATRLQDLTLSSRGLVGNIISFNVGVEVGQMLALTAVLLLLTLWRRSSSFATHAFTANAVLMCGGFVLAASQLTGFFLTLR